MSPRAVFRATTIEVAGVNDVLPFSCAPRSACPVPVEARQTSNRAAFSHARAEIDAKARPGGVIRAFCDPVTTTSIPHASVSSGTAPRLEIASTTEIAPASLQAAASDRMSETTPVEVSECTMKATAAPLSASEPRDILCAGRLAPLVRERDDVGSRRRRPASASASRTRRARRRAPSPRARGDWRRRTRTRPCPDAVKTRMSFCVRKTSCSRSSTSRKTVLKSGERWWMTGSASAASTSGGTGVGPGVRR